MYILSAANREVILVAVDDCSCNIERIINYVEQPFHLLTIVEGAYEDAKGVYCFSMRECRKRSACDSTWQCRGPLTKPHLAREATSRPLSSSPSMVALRDTDPEAAVEVFCVDKQSNKTHCLLEVS